MAAGNYVNDDDILVHAIQDEINKARAAKAPENAGIKVVVNDKEFRYKDEAELNSAVSGTLAEAKRLIEAEKAKREALEAQLAEYAAKVEAKAKPVNDDEFSTQRFQEIAQSDFLKALDYANKFTPSVRALREENEALKKNYEAQNTAFEASHFKSLHPEYQATPENAAKLEEIRNAYGLPFTSQGLEAAYSIAKDRNVLPDPVKMQMAQIVQNMQQNMAVDPRSGRPVMPAPGRGTSDANTWEQIGEEMTDDQLEAVLRNPALMASRR